FPQRKTLKRFPGGLQLHPYSFHHRITSFGFKVRQREKPMILRIFADPEIKM
ncbi:mCG145178, partial [Mus musculus]